MLKNALNPNSKYGNASFHEALRVQKITCHAEDRTALINRQWISLMNFSQHDGNSALTSISLSLFKSQLFILGWKVTPLGFMSLGCACASAEPPNSGWDVAFRRSVRAEQRLQCWRHSASWQQLVLCNCMRRVEIGERRGFDGVCACERECSTKILDLPYRVVSVVVWL